MKDIEDIYELSPMQQGMLFHTLYAPDSGVYFEQLICTLSPDLNISAFQQAWQQVVARHSILRSSFYWEDLEKPLQIVKSQVELSWFQDDWSNLSTDEQQQHLEAFLEGDRHQGFELDKSPLMRFALMQLGNGNYQFVWSHHHLLCDGWSMPIILKEVFAFYDANLKGDRLRLQPPRPYRDYITWLQQQDLSQAKNFWRQALQGFTAPTPLVVDKLASGNSHQYQEEYLKLSTQQTTALSNLARQHHLTLNNLVQGAWSILLSRYSGETDVVFGATVSGRPPTIAGVESMVGLFINTLPVRLQVSPTAELLPWLKTLQAQQVEREQYSYSPLFEIQQLSEVPPGVALFESLLVFENYPMDSSGNQQQSLEVSNLRCVELTNYPLTAIAVPRSELSIRISYDTSRFQAETIRRMLGHFQTILEEIIVNPHRQISELSMLTAAERQQLLVEWNQTQVDYPIEKSIHQLFEEQVARTPDAVAVVWENQQLTYQELNAKSNQLAHHLQALGVKPEVLVGICVDRSLDMVVGLLGILKAGGAYVPLDPAYPQERLSFILSDAQAPVLLTQNHLVEKLNISELRGNIVCLDQISQNSEENPVSGVTANNLAYVIYTSGSTGKPKGVAIEHRSTVTLLHWAKDTFAKEDIAGVLASTSICFDLSVFELFVPLSWGGKNIVVDNILHLSRDLDITLINTVPSAIAQLLKVNGIPSTVTTVNLAGEPLQNKLVQELYQQDSIQRVFNLYGPSEDTTYSTYSLVRKGDELVTIGQAIANTQIYILDQFLQPVAIGVVGELYIGGDGLARGYLNRPGLTGERFINLEERFAHSPLAFPQGRRKDAKEEEAISVLFPSPQSPVPSPRLYKTGDLARYLPDGNVEFLGRIDYQVKIRGFRIELLEVEAVLGQFSGVREAVVIVREDVSGDRLLVAYVVSKDEQFNQNELRRFLREKLPDYMIPTTFVLLSALPLTPNGKVDRLALPAPEQGRREVEASYVAPQSEIEQGIAAVWQEVLHLEKVGVHDNFFELGGHSLLIIQVYQKLREGFHHDVSIVDLFQYPTISTLAKYLGQDNEAEQLVISGQIHDRTSKQKEAIKRQQQLTQQRRKGNG